MQLSLWSFTDLIGPCVHTVRAVLRTGLNRSGRPSASDGPSAPPALEPWAYIHPLLNNRSSLCHQLGRADIWHVLTDADLVTRAVSPLINSWRERERESHLVKQHSVWVCAQQLHTWSASTRNEDGSYFEDVVRHKLTYRPSHNLKL